MKTEALAAEEIALTKAAGKEWGWQHFAEVARLIQEEEEQGSTDTAGSLPALPTNTLTIKK